MQAKPGVLYMQEVLGFDAVETGLAFLPVALLIGTLSLGFSARLNTRYGARALPSLMTLAMSGATQRDSGLASGLVNTSVQVGGAIGLAVLATLAAERTDGLLAGGDSAAEALTSGYRLAFAIGAGLVTVAIALAVTVLQRETEAAEQVEEEARGGLAPPSGQTI